MKVFTITRDIEEPYWKYLAFGIAKCLLDEHGAVQTRCSYRYKSGPNKGQLQFPHMYRIDSVKALSAVSLGRYKTMLSKNGSTLVIIPIAEFEIVLEPSVV